MPKKAPHDPKRDVRIAWLCNKLHEGETDVDTLVQYMTDFPGIAEEQARRELKEVYDRYDVLNIQNQAARHSRYAMVLWGMRAEFMATGQGSAAVQIMKLLLQLDKQIADGTTAKSDQVSAQPIPVPEVLHERIKQLLNDTRVKEHADAAGIDIKLMAKKAGYESK